MQGLGDKLCVRVVENGLVYHPDQVISKYLYNIYSEKRKQKELDFLNILLVLV